LYSIKIINYYAYKCKHKMNTNDIKIVVGRRYILNNVIITLRTNEEIKKELDMLALEENRSLNNLIVTILIKYLDETKKNKEKIKL